MLWSESEPRRAVARNRKLADRSGTPRAWNVGSAAVPSQARIAARERERRSTFRSPSPEWRGGQGVRTVATGALAPEEQRAEADHGREPEGEHPAKQLGLEPSELLRELGLYLREPS